MSTHSITSDRPINQEYLASTDTAEGYDLDIPFEPELFNENCDDQNLSSHGLLDANYELSKSRNDISNINNELFGNSVLDGTKASRTNNLGYSDVHDQRNDTLEEEDKELSSSNQQRMMVGANTADINDVMVTKRVRKPTQKGFEYQLQQLIKSRRNQELRLERVMAEIDVMLHTGTSEQAVKERMHQVDDVFDLVSSTHNELLSLLKFSNHQYNIEAENEFLFSLDEKVFNLKYRIQDTFKQVPSNNSGSEKGSKRGSHRTSSRSSSRSSRSSSSSSASVKERALEEKIKLAELMTSASYLKEKKDAQLQAEKIKLEEEMAMARARVAVFEEDLKDGELHHEVDPSNPQKDILERKDGELNSSFLNSRHEDSSKNGKSSSSQARHVQFNNWTNWSNQQRKRLVYPKIYHQHTSNSFHQDEFNSDGIANEEKNQHPQSTKESICNRTKVKDDESRCKGETAGEGNHQRLYNHPTSMLRRPLSHHYQQQHYDDHYLQQRRKNESQVDETNFQQQSRCKSSDDISKEMNASSDESKSNTKDLMTEMLCQLLKQQAAPVVDIDVYDGNPLNYHYFMASFKEVVEKNVQDDRGRLTRLIKYTSGEARDLIQHCIQLSSSTGYATAKDLLERRYGNSYTVISAYRREIKNWPTVKGGDATGFRKFHNFLIKCQSISSSLTWNVLENPDTICTLLTKLPVFVIDKWNSKVLSIRRKKDREPRFNDFVDFIEQETILVSDPLFSRQAVEKLSNNKEKKGKVQSYATQMDESEIKIEAPSSKESCILCYGEHDLDDCVQYMAKTVGERSAFLTSRRLCYGCYIPITSDHNARNCPKRRTCKECNGKHPTGLHGYRHKKKESNTATTQTDDQPEENLSSNSTQIDTKDVKTFTTNVENEISMGVVPIVIRHKDTNKEMSTFALLDPCSQGCFVKDDIIKKLGVGGATTKVIITTLSGGERNNSTVVTGLEVKSAITSFKEIWINLPKVYTRTHLPVSTDDIATPEKLQRWDHLQSICKDICSSDNVEIGILIGANCLPAVEPVRIISSKNGGPYAFQTKLGWGVVGPLNPKKSGSLACNKIMVRETLHNSSSTHCLAVETKVKDLGIAELMMKIYENDFVEPQMTLQKPAILSDADEVSLNDTKFLKIMDKEVTMRDGQYVLPLPLKNPDAQLPNNRSQAMQRLQYLKKKLSKDEKFFKDYKEFMKEIISKGYARECDNPGVKGRTWYIPHFGVYDSNKPDKIRVVFDCSAEFKGTSLNQSLLSGPDLTNQLVGVLMRFRQEEVANIFSMSAMIATSSWLEC